MKGAIVQENEDLQWNRFFSTMVIASVGLARDDTSTPNPRLVAAVADSVARVKMILARVARR
ncbi:MAG: hypothetical protein WBG54_08035 [Acidobacteriaceae bacterium]